MGARLPGKGFRHVERNGWSMSKDNNDIERKFWKDDFSVDSSSQYTGDVGNFTWDTANSRLTSLATTSPKYVYKSCSNPGYISVVFSYDSATSSDRYLYLYANTDGSDRISILYSGNSTITNIRCVVRIGGVNVYDSVFSSAGAITDEVRLSIAINSDSVVFYKNGVAIKTYSGAYIPLVTQVSLGRYSPDAGTAIFKDFSILPSISYSDDFTSDTVSGANGRYQAVTGTVAYDNANKRMNITTAAGANGKASGRLKSYKFCEGAQQFDVTLPVGADGDFICLVTHSANGLMTDGIGVGLQPDGAGNWNLVTLSNTTVTVGASSGLTDGKTARIEIEKDITGAYWYYIV